MEKKKTSIIFWLLVSGCILTSLIQTALNTALAPIMDEMNLSAGTVQWLSSGYSLVMGIMVLATPFLIKRLPTKSLYLSSIAIFAVGSLMSAVAKVFPLLMIGRLLQAVSCGILMSLTQVVIFRIFPKNETGTMMGIYGLAVCGAPVIAPGLSGIIIDSFSWNMLFWISFVIAVVLFIGGSMFMQNVTEAENISFDYVSMILCSLGYAGITLGIGNISDYSFLSIYSAVPLLAGIICMAIFVMRQHKMEKTFITLALFKVKEFRIAVIVSMIMYVVMMAGSTMVPLYVQNMRGFSATLSGLIAIPSGIATAVMSALAGKLYDKIGIRKIYLVGSVILLIASIGFVFMGKNTSVAYITFFFAFRSVGIGLLMMTTVTWGMSRIPEKDTSDGTALISSLRTVAGSVGQALFVGIISVVAGSHETSAMINGLDISFAWMAVLAGVLVAIAIVFLGRKQGAQTVDA